MNQILKPFTKGKSADIILLDIITDISSIPEKKGAYIFASSSQAFVYPNGNSKVIYIGKADNLKVRVKTHWKHILEVQNTKRMDRHTLDYYSRYQYLAKFKPIVLFCFTTRGKQEAKNLESDLLKHFYNRYLSLPVGNGAFSFKS